VFFALWSITGQAQVDEASGSRLSEPEWVDSVYRRMDLDQKIGQLFMIRAHSDKGADHIQSVSRAIQKYHVGGLCFFQGTPEKQAALTNQYQRQSEVPLMVAMDAEWGLGMRHKSAAPNYPRQLTLGAIQDNRWIYELGLEIGRELRAIGTHINFAPVVDINNNPANPVIHDRSFGENRYQVAAKAIHYSRGLAAARVMACAKHFPGHGDTDTDSHYDLPVIRHDTRRLDSIEFFPFKALVQEGVPSIMVAHLHIPSLDSRDNRPTTLSRKVVTGILREQWNYDGLIFTDALEMQGVLKFFKPGEAELEAFKAGNDVLLLPQDLAAGFSRLKKALQTGEITEAALEEKVKRILRAKYRLYLDGDVQVDTESIRSFLDRDATIALASNLYEKAVTLARREQEIMPVTERSRIFSIALGGKGKNTFQRMLGSYGVERFEQMGYDFGPEELQAIGVTLNAGDIPVISLHGLSKDAKKQFGITQSVIELIQYFSKLKMPPVVLVFGSPYSLAHLGFAENVVVCYEDDDRMQQAAAQALCGGIPFEGRLPVTASPQFRFNQGYLTQDLGILHYGLPEQEGLSGDTLDQIREIIREMIDKKAAPGGQVVVLRNGRMVFNESFGYFTYEKSREVKIDDLYDLASLTKILAGTASIMRLHSNDRVDLSSPLSRYIRELQNSNKSDLRLGDIMAHRAGLVNWIPFYQRTIESLRRTITPKPEYYKDISSETYAIPVADHLFLRSDYRDSIWEEILLSPVDSNPEYVYSDLGFYMVSELVHRVDGRPIDRYFDEEIARRLGLINIGYNPLERGIDKERITPSEKDEYYRQQTLQGFVHDMGAAMWGGVSGHAGLFSNATDVAVMMQCFLNKGHYNGVRLFDEAVVERFTRRHPESTRRGIGFDMKETDPAKGLNMAPEASEMTFGHLGFTGTCAWADPANGLVFVFLSNRTYPSMQNNLFSRQNYRPRLQSVVYRAINDRP